MARPAELALKPRSLDKVQVAEVPISALTAWQAVFERARLARAGQGVLIHGARLAAPAASLWSLPAGEERM